MKRDRTEFLARESYRKRRMVDAARFLPAFGLVLIVLPTMRRDPTLEAPPTASESEYLFLVWAILIFGAFFLSLILRKVMVENDATKPLSPPPSPEHNTGEKG